MSIITIVDFPAIRGIIDTKLTETDVPNNLIAQDIYQGAAEAWAISRDADAESRTGDDLLRVKRAVVFYTASLLVPAVARLTSLSIQTGDVSYSRPAMDIPKRVKELRSLAESEIAELLTPEETAPARPISFARAPAGRGK